MSPATRESPILSWAAYARYSDRKQDRSVVQQIDQFKKYAADNAITVPDEFIFSDEAKSGKSDVSREGLLSLMAFLERRPRLVAGVLLWSSSRLSRNMDDADWYKASIRRAGYQIVYIGERMLEQISGLEGRLMEDVTEYVDAKYRENLARDVVRGMVDELGEGNVVSRAPRGYGIGMVGDKRRFVIDSQHAAAVRQAWALRAAGHSLQDVHEATHLYKTSQGYANMFHNQTYTGRVVWRGREFPDMCEPLCTPAQWEAVQLANGAHVHPRRVRSTYLLSGLAVCECGSLMFGQSSEGANGQQYRYYRCRPELTRGICNHMPADQLEAHVIERARAQLTAKALAPYIDIWRARRRAGADPVTSETDRRRARLAEVERAIASLVAVVEAGNAPRSIVDRLAQREAEYAGISATLSSAPAPAAGPDMGPIKVAKAIGCRLASGEADQQRPVLRALVKRVTVRKLAGEEWPREVDIVFNRLDATGTERK